jgi:DNA-binding NarL/FixJ family response regulator
MRVLLVGSSSDRARLRSQVNGSMEIAGEFASLAAARASEVDHDAILVAGGGASSAPTRDDDRFGRRGQPLTARPEPVEGRAPMDQPWLADPDEEAGFDEPLTPREIQVLELLAEGLPNKAIAARLHISDQTVKFHVSSISGKLGAANRTDAVRLAVRRGLITL